jgi:uncharacterized membrane protein YhfC
MNPLFLLQGIGMISVALIAVLYWKRRGQVPFAFFLWGGLSWLVAMVFKSSAASLTPQIITSLRDLMPIYVADPLVWLYIGLLTGVFECGVALVVIRLIQRIRSASWHEALGYGLGFGACEAILLGIYSFVIVLLILLIPEQLPPVLMESTETSQASLLAIPVPIVERAIVVMLHAFSSVLIIYAVQKKEWAWFWLSFLYKTAMDTIAGYIQIGYGVQNLTLAGAWLVELVLVPFALIGLWGLIVFRSRWQSNGPVEC